MEIDGVFSGGGIKAFAFIGAYQVLEEKNYQFKRVAGTSAGAIVAAFIAAGYTVNEIENILDDLNLKSLLDPPKKSFLLPFTKWINLYFKFGLYKGDALEEWFYKQLANKGIYTFADLPKGKLKLVASDLSSGRMIVLPDDLSDYGIDWKTFSVARALRMSCGLPFFFEPVILKNRDGSYFFVDGGILSNFPMWIFDNEKKERPLLGLKLSQPREQLPPQQFKNGLNLFEALFTAMRIAHDERYISRKHERNIIFIPVENFSTTNFNIDQETKKTLIDIGRKRTEKFLKRWMPVI